LGLLAVGGCGFVQRSFKSTTPPMVSVEGARTTTAPQTGVAGGPSVAPGQLVLIDLFAENPNSDDLPVLAIAYDVTLRDGIGEFRYTGTRKGQATLGKFGAQRIELPVPVPAGAMAMPTTFDVRGTIEYLRPAAIARTMQENGLGGTTTSFRATGAVAGFTPSGQ